MQESRELKRLTQEKYNALNEAKVVAIAPGQIANSVYADISEDKQDIPLLVHIAAVLHLRQVAREVCREKSEEEQKQIEEQESLFPFRLQGRYPCDRSGEPHYVYRQHLTYMERLENINRLEREAGAKQAHADALREETDLLVRNGTLKIEQADAVQSERHIEYWDKRVQ